MGITRDEVEHVAMLARLNLSEAEKTEYTGQLNAILDYAETLQELDLTAVKPTAHAAPLVNVLRDDEIRESLAKAEALAGAPAGEDGFFSVPKIV